MLVLTRKVGERIQLGDDIWVTIVRIDENCVRIGIEAPAETSIMRTELVSRSACGARGSAVAFGNRSD